MSAADRALYSVKAEKATARRWVSCAISSAAARHSSRLRLTRATSAPASASAVAMTLPSPFEPPVTSARRPFSRNKSKIFVLMPPYLSKEMTLPAVEEASLIAC